MVKSLCIRCGKQRVVMSVFQETIGTAVITRTETACADLDCQKKVDHDLEKEKERRLQAIASPRGIRIPARK